MNEDEQSDDGLHMRDEMNGGRVCREMCIRYTQHGARILYGARTVTETPWRDLPLTSPERVGWPNFCARALGLMSASWSCTGAQSADEARKRLVYEG